LRAWPDRCESSFPTGNHYHLFLQTPGADLTAKMHLSRKNLTPREEMPIIHPAAEADAGICGANLGSEVVQQSVALA
jgi:hypothetical protein